MFGHRFLRNFGIIPLLLVLVQHPTPVYAGTVDMLADVHASTEVVAEEVVETTAHEEDFFMVMEVSAEEKTTETTEVNEATEEVVEETTEVTEATEAIEEEVVEETIEVTEATEPIEEVVVTEPTEVIEETEWNGEVLKCKKGYVEFGPTGYETWYDLDMSVVVKNMREKYGIDLEYWVDEETGLKMYGDYIMVAADVRSKANPNGIFEYGDIIEVSHGTAMVVDCCRLAINKRQQSGKIHIDIATDWAHTYSIRER